MARRSGVGQRAACPECGQRLGEKDGHERVIGNKTKLVYMCPQCAAYLKRVSKKSASVSMLLVLLVVIFAALDLGYLVYTKDMCVFSLLGIFFLILFQIVKFAYGNTFVAWYPQCTKCGYDMRCSRGDCPECGGKAETYPQEIAGPVNSLDRDLQSK